MVLLGLCVTSGLRFSGLLFSVSVAMLLGSIVCFFAIVGLLSWYAACICTSSSEVVIFGCASTGVMASINSFLYLFPLHRIGRHTSC